MEENQLQRKDMSVRTVVFMIFCVCAAGAYGLEEMIPLAGPGLTIIMILVIPLLWSLPMAMIAAELGASMPEAGGSYVWVRKGLGEFWGFQMGWWKTLAVFTDSTLYIILAGNYFGYVLGFGSTLTYAIQIAIVLLFVAVNLRGIEEVGTVSTIISILVLALFGLIAILGFMNWNVNPMSPMIPEGQSLITSVGGAIAIGLWMFAGYEGISSLAGEVKNPKVIPKATLITLPVVILVYLLPTVAGLASVGNWEQWSSSSNGFGYGSVLIEFGVPAMGIVFGIVAVIAQCSMYNTLLAGGSRVLFALADDNLAPKKIGSLSKKRKIPAFNIVLIGAANIIICAFDFTVVVVIDVLLILSFYCLIFISMIALRKKKPEMERPIKIPGSFPFIVAICTVPIALAVITFFISGTDYFFGGLLAVSTGPIMYFIWKRKYGGLAAKDPENFPINEKTKLAPGDLYRTAKLFLIFGIVAFLGRVFLAWYEGDWGPAYYAETYGSDVFSGLLSGISITGSLLIIMSILAFTFAKKTEKNQLKLLK